MLQATMKAAKDAAKAKDGAQGIQPAGLRRAKHQDERNQRGNHRPGAVAGVAEPVGQAACGNCAGGGRREGGEEAQLSGAALGAAGIGGRHEGLGQADLPNPGQCGQGGQGDQELQAAGPKAPAAMSAGTAQTAPSGVQDRVPASGGRYSEKSLMLRRRRR